jgi:hypothetical protein
MTIENKYWIAIHGETIHFGSNINKTILNELFWNVELFDTEEEYLNRLTELNINIE